MESSPRSAFRCAALLCGALLLVGLASCSDGPEPTVLTAEQIQRINAMDPIDLDGLMMGEENDTAVRGLQLIALYCSAVEGHPVASYYGMFTDEGNLRQQELMARKLESIRPDLEGLTKQERIEFIWGDSWLTDVIVTPEDCPQVETQNDRSRSADAG